MAERAYSRESQDTSDQVSGRQVESCQPCKKKNRTQIATLFCKDCKQYQCEECSKTHDIFDCMSGHDIVKADKDFSFKPVLDMTGLDKCKDHIEILKFYCVDEQKLCCNTCAITRHRSCVDVQEISSETEKHPFNTSDMESAIQELQDTANNLVELLKKIKYSTSCKLESVLDVIDSTKKTLMFKFDQLKLAVTEQFQSAKEMLTAQINTSMTTTEGISDELREKKDLLMSSKTFGTPEQQFIASNLIQNQLMTFKKTLQNEHSSLYNLDCSIECSKQLTELLEPNTSLATFTLDKIPIAVQLKHLITVNLKQGEDDIKEPLYTGMDFFPDGRLAVIDNPNKKLCIMIGNLERKGTFMFSGYRLDVCVISEEEVAVTSGGVYLIEFLHVSKTNDITLIRKVNTTARYFSICLMNETTFLVSTIGDKRPLRMITLAGEESDFDDLPKKQYTFDASKSTYIGNKNIAVLTDMNEHSVYMYDVKQKGFPRQVVKHDYIKEPTGACVGPNDCLFVCSKNTNSIVQVSPSGKVLSSHKMDDISYPRTICVSKEGRRLLVSNCTKGKKKLQMFYLHI